MIFSIVTIVKDSPEDLEVTIKSVINQSFKDFEYIVIDGGSNAETQLILSKYKNCIDKLVSEPDEGIYHAINKGISCAVGEWVNFLNAGDYYYKQDALNIFRNSIDNDKNIIFSTIFHQDKDNDLFFRDQKFPFTNSIYFSINHQSIFFNKLNLKDILFHDTTFKVAADTDLLFRIYMQNPKGFGIKIEEPLVVYKLGGYSMKNFDLMLDERREIIKKYIKNPILRHYNLRFLINKSVGNSRLLKLYNKTLSKHFSIFKI